MRFEDKTMVLDEIIKLVQNGKAELEEEILKLDKQEILLRTKEIDFLINVERCLNLLKKAPEEVIPSIEVLLLPKQKLAKRLVDYYTNIFHAWEKGGYTYSYESYVGFCYYLRGAINVLAVEYGVTVVDNKDTGLPQTIGPEKVKKLSKGNELFGLIWSGCTDINNAIDFINREWSQANIMMPGAKYRSQDCFTFEHNGKTCLVLPFDKHIPLNTDKLAAWRMQARSEIAIMWVEDYVINCMEEL